MRLSLFQRNIFYSQVCFWLTMVVCIILAPTSLQANSGISYFGHHLITVAPFELGMFATAYFLLQAQSFVRLKRELRVLYWCLLLITIGVIGVAIAPATGSGLLDILHRIFGSLAFVTQLILAAWLTVKFKADIFGWLLYLLLLTGGIVALIYLEPAEGYAIQGQLLFQLAFSMILMRYVPKLSKFTF